MVALDRARRNATQHLARARVFRRDGVPFGLVLALVLAGCSDGSPDPEPSCDEVEPTFVAVIAAEGDLPAGLVVKLTYGGGQEVYESSSPPAHREVMFCDRVKRASVEEHLDAEVWVAAGGPEKLPPSMGGAGGAGGVEDALRCDLWTDSGATVEVSAPGMLPVTEELAGEDGCESIVTGIELEVDRPVDD